MKTNFYEKHVPSHRCGSSLSRVTCGKAKFCLRIVRWFFPGFSSFHPPLMNDWLDISEIFLNGAVKTKSKKKKEKHVPMGMNAPDLSHIHVHVLKSCFQMTSTLKLLGPLGSYFIFSMWQKEQQKFMFFYGDS